jgi:hypothetical protein
MLYRYELELAEQRFSMLLDGFFGGRGVWRDTWRVGPSDWTSCGHMNFCKLPLVLTK